MYGHNRYYKHKKAPLTANERKRQRKERRNTTYGISEESENKEEWSEMESGITEFIPTINSFEVEVENLEGIEVLKKRLQDKIIESGRTISSKSERQKDRKSRSADQVDTSPTDPSANDVSSGDSEEEQSAQSSDEFSYDANGFASEDSDISEDMHENSENQVVDDVGDIDFSGIVATKNAAAGDVGIQNKPGSKMKRLKKLVEASKRKKQRIEDLKSQGDIGKDRAVAETWNDVIKEASGEKVLSSTKRLQKAIKSREKKKAKSAAAWQGRLDKLAADKSERIQKRENNIRERKLGKVAPSPVTPTESTGTKAPTRKERAVFAKKLAAKKESKENATGTKKGDKKK